MKQKIVLFMILAIIAGFGVLILFNLSPFVRVHTPKYLSKEPHFDYVSNVDKDLSVKHEGPKEIRFGWSGVSSNLSDSDRDDNYDSAKDFLFSQSDPSQTSWITIDKSPFTRGFNNLKIYVDNSKDACYKMQILDGSGAVLKDYKPVCLSKFDSSSYRLVRNVSQKSADVKFRDDQRIVDVEQILRKLSSHYFKNNTYPDSLSALVPKYLSSVPKAPVPPDGSCDSNTNQYFYRKVDETHYIFRFCLSQEHKKGRYIPGVNVLGRGGPIQTKKVIVSEKATLTVTKQAIIKRGGKQYVRVVINPVEMTFKEVEVTTKFISDREIEVISGLEDGQTIITFL